VNENVFSTLLLYEAIALRIVEPLHFSLDHGNASGDARNQWAPI
jgi:hypothetical protein